MMKYTPTLCTLAAGLILLLCACAPAGSPAASSPREEPMGQPLEITDFSFRHTASRADDCYAFTLTREEEGTRLVAEELFLRGRTADVLLGEEVLTRLGELLGKYHVEQWDGFDAGSGCVLDGSSFELQMTLADGTTVHAKGNNRFPDHYSEVYSPLWQLFSDWMEQHGQAAQP